MISMFSPKTLISLVFVCTLTRVIQPLPILTDLQRGTKAIGHASDKFGASLKKLFGYNHSGGIHTSSPLTSDTITFSSKNSSANTTAENKSKSTLGSNSTKLTSSHNIHYKGSKTSFHSSKTSSTYSSGAKSSSNSSSRVIFPDDVGTIDEGNFTLTVLSTQSNLTGNGGVVETVFPVPTFNQNTTENEKSHSLPEISTSTADSSTNGVIKENMALPSPSIPVTEANKENFMKILAMTEGYNVEKGELPDEIDASQNPDIKFEDSRTPAYAFRDENKSYTKKENASPSGNNWTPPNRIVTEISSLKNNTPTLVLDSGSKTGRKTTIAMKTTRISSHGQSSQSPHHLKERHQNPKMTTTTSGPTPETTVDAAALQSSVTSAMPSCNKISALHSSTFTSEEMPEKSDGSNLVIPTTENALLVESTINKASSAFAPFCSDSAQPDEKTSVLKEIDKLWVWILLTFFICLTILFIALIVLYYACTRRLCKCNFAKRISDQGPIETSKQEVEQSDVEKEENLTHQTAISKVLMSVVPEILVVDENKLSKSADNQHTTEDSNNTSVSSYQYTKRSEQQRNIHASKIKSENQKEIDPPTHNGAVVSQAVSISNHVRSETKNEGEGDYLKEGRLRSDGFQHQSSDSENDSTTTKRQDGSGIPKLTFKPKEFKTLSVNQVKSNISLTGSESSKGSSGSRDKTLTQVSPPSASTFGGSNIINLINGSSTPKDNQFLGREEKVSRIKSEFFGMNVKDEGGNVTNSATDSKSFKYQYHTFLDTYRRMEERQRFEKQRALTIISCGNSNGQMKQNQDVVLYINRDKGWYRLGTSDASEGSITKVHKIVQVDD